MEIVNRILPNVRYFHKMLKLPRTELKPEEISKVETYFQSETHKVWEGSSHLVSYFELSPAIKEGFQAIIRTGCFSQGLESIAKLLEDEKKGLDEVQRKTNQPATQRMSRLLFISNDGSERFYRQVASLLTAHGNRLWCCRLNAPSEDLGPLVNTVSAKALMITDKKALALFLTTLARHSQ